ncbi:alkaline phosphatase family protein [Candidatus Nitrosopelagicus sp.]|nr:alkaline phosphatase family protein [Candidatus Nitrosopelagicus sp.]
MKKIIVLDIPGLVGSNIDKNETKNIPKIIKNNHSVLNPTFPAVTCSAQSSILTGTYPSEHGIIANGYYDKTYKEIHFWDQPSKLVKKPQIWDILKEKNSKIKTAVLFWQNTLFAKSDTVITPKPIHLENNFVMWCYSKPENFYEEISEEIGEFDLKWYWGPFASIESSKWIINATKITIKNHNPDLLLTYIPHLDYAGQKYGPESIEFQNSLSEVDELIGNLIDFLQSEKLEYEIIILSEYGFNQVNNSISPNIILNDNLLLQTRNIGGKEYIDFELSKAFAMCDHQIAHIFIKPGFEETVTKIFEKQPIGKILNKKMQKELHIDNERSGDIILMSEKNSWFNYHWWTDEKFAPDFTFSVDIHRKPGFDPLELFFDMKTKKISHDTSLIHGSHGIIDNEISKLPIIGTTISEKKLPEKLDMVEIMPRILDFLEV